MNIYTCKFAGRFIAGNAIVAAPNRGLAAKKINAELEAVSLVGDRTKDDMEKFDPTESVRILSDGDY